MTKRHGVARIGYATTAGHDGARARAERALAWLECKKLARRKADIDRGPLRGQDCQTNGKQRLRALVPGRRSRSVQSVRAQYSIGDSPSSRQRSSPLLPELREGAMQSNLVSLPSAD